MSQFEASLARKKLYFERPTPKNRDNDKLLEIIIKNHGKCAKITKPATTVKPATASRAASSTAASRATRTPENYNKLITAKSKQPTTPSSITIEQLQQQPLQHQQQLQQRELQQEPEEEHYIFQIFKQRTLSNLRYFY